jgi:beta-lactamase family protein
MRWFARTHVVRALAVVTTLVLGAAIVALTAVFTYRHTDRHVAVAPSSTRRPPAPAPTAPATAPAPVATKNPEDLAAQFSQLAARLQAKMGIAISAVGDAQSPTTWGDWQEGPAWSTIKVPLVIAAYRHREPRQVTDLMRAVITESDNTAAESLWEQLGDPPAAAEQVQQVLRQTGDQATTVQSRKVRPEFSAFGQTIWSLVNQTRFTASAFCDSENGPIFDLMGQVTPDQNWGIGKIAGTQFKGGWGPSPAGRYLVRQIGVLTTPAGKAAVAIAAEPASGAFDDGTRDLDEVAKWLKEHLEELPAGQCGR